MTFSTLERRLSWTLARTPRLRLFLKNAYQWLNFILWKERNFTSELRPDTQIKTPSEIARVSEPPRGVSEFFGYFNVSPWSPDGRFYVTHNVLSSNGAADITVYDFLACTRRKVASTRTWTWQQGSMAHWINIAGELRLLFNGMQARRLGMYMYTPEGDPLGFLPYPLQAANELHRCFYSTNYVRLARNGTEYGYDIDASNFHATLADTEDGLWKVDFDTGDAALLVSIAHLRTLCPKVAMTGNVHEVNHVSVSPDGSHLLFVHRYRGPRGQFSRLFLARHDGSGLRLLLDDDMVSHYAWLSPKTVVTWARTHSNGDRYYVIDITTTEIHVLPGDTVNKHNDGHPAPAATHGWIATDSYPDRRRQQHLFLFDREGNYRPVGRFLLPMSFTGAARIDLHPRWNTDENLISIDAGFSGSRRNYIVDVSALIGHPRRRD